MPNPANLIAPMLKERGFVKRGSAFFRIHGDGVVQVLQYQRQSDGYYLYMGLHSMYGELLKQWFTFWGCIPRYEILLLDGKRELPDRWERKGLDTDRMQAELLREKGIPFLNGIRTQKELADAIFSLDGHWNDDMKFAPLLSCKDYENAAQVLSAIIRQHETVRKLKQEYLSEEDFRKHQERWEPVTAHFRELLDMTRRCDDGEIRKWLEQNYAVNADYAKFCLK